MSQLTDIQLGVKAAQIIAEVVPEANTKERVGGLNQDIIDSKINKTQIDTATTLGTANDKVPSQNAVKAYIDNATTGLLDDRGNYNASGNVFPSTGGSGTSGAIKKGDLWYISVAGTGFVVGSSIRALVDSPGQTSGNWAKMDNGLGYTPENSANKSTNVATDAASDTKYPSAKAVATYVAANASLPWKSYTVRLAQSGPVAPNVQATLLNTLTNTGVPTSDPAFVSISLGRFGVGSCYLHMITATAIDPTKVGIFWSDAKIENDTFTSGSTGSLFVYDFFFNIFNHAGVQADGFSFVTVDVRLYA